MCSTSAMTSGGGNGHLLVERDGHTMVVTMNRPERRNALSPEMMAGMAAARDEANADPDVRVVILTVADIARGVIKPLLKGFLRDKPLVAAVEGPAIAGGTEILQATDVRIAGESARFGISEVRWGLYPLGGSVVRLRRQVPYAVAADLLLTGRHLTAGEAREVGLIGEVVPDGTALDRAREVAATIAANGPVAVQAVLQALRATEGVSEREAMRLDSEIGMAVYASDDPREGARAFVEKRAPQFTGH